MAFINFRKCFSSPNHLLKLLIVVGCICFSVYQVIQCTHKLLNPPISTYYGFHLNKSMKYPSFTFCREPAFKTDLFPKYGLRSASDLMVNNAFKNFNFYNYTIAEFLSDTTWSFQELIASFAFNGVGNSFTDLEVIEFQSITKGRCFTLNPKTTSQIFSIFGGWWFYMKHNLTVESIDSYGMSTNGFHIYLHDSNEIMTSETEQESSCLEYIYLEAAEDIRMNLHVEEFKKISTTEQQCISSTNNVEYSKSRCQEKCIHYQIAQELNCTLPWLSLITDVELFPQCSNFTDVQNLINNFNSQNRLILAEKCSHCHMACDETIYTPMILRRKSIADRNYPNSFIAVYYTTNLVKYMNEQIAYNLSSFVADIGGSLGFLLGLSVIGFIGFLEKILGSIIKRHFRKQQKENESEEIHSPPRDVDNKCSDKSDNLINHDKEKRSEKPHLYDNLHDFESDDFRCYQNTLL